MEVWKPIEGCDGYEVSNLGRVRTLKKWKTPHILKQYHYLKSPYLSARFYIGGKHKVFRVNRLVAKAFIPNPEGKPFVNHINGVKTDNRVENLEWATVAENTQHAINTGLQKIQQGADASSAKLTAEQVIYIRDNPNNLTTYQLGEMFGVSDSNISIIQRGLSYKNVGGSIRGKIKSRVPDEIRAQICAEYKKGIRGCGRTTLAKKYGYSETCIRDIVSKI